MRWTYRLTNIDDPEERLEEAALWKAMHDEYGSAIRPVMGDEPGTFGRPRQRDPMTRLDYWNDPAFLKWAGRRFSVTDAEGLDRAVRELHDDGLGAFVKSTQDKHCIIRVPVGTRWQDEMDAMIYSFIDGGPQLPPLTAPLSPSTAKRPSTATEARDRSQRPSGAASASPLASSSLNQSLACISRPVLPTRTLKSSIGTTTESAPGPLSRAGSLP